MEDQVDQGDVHARQRSFDSEEEQQLQRSEGGASDSERNRHSELHEAGCKEAGAVEFLLIVAELGLAYGAAECFGEITSG